MRLYATLDDLVARYGAIDGEEAARAEILLADASALIIAAGGVATDMTDEEAAAYRAVCCAMVHRVMISPAWAALGVTQHSQTAGSFTESFSYGNPNGDLFMTKSERKTLRLGGTAIGSILPTGVDARAGGER